MVALPEYQGMGAILDLEGGVSGVWGDGDGKMYADHSDGAKRLTPAATEASMRAVWTSMAVPATKERTVFTPVRTAARSVGEV